MKPHQKEVLEMPKKGFEGLLDQLEVVEDVPRFGGRGKWDKDGLKELLGAVKGKLEEVGEGKAIRVRFEVIKEFYNGEFKGRSTDGRKDPEIRRVLKPIAKKMGVQVTVTKDGDVYVKLGE